ncbi:MAG: Multiple EGF-like-domain protein 3 precursor, partial [Myxococcaceae bacterium]|nr:Multiple EGF-like-domain protein 3 precursor [Myxococcaceae bacterium]
KVLSGLRGGDCNDANAAINPGVLEICDGLDNNCDGTIDEGYMLVHCYPDLDGDGYPNLEGMSRTLCTCPSGTVAVATPIDKKLDDCLDDPKTGADVHPNQTKFFSEPYNAGPGRTGSFDYDCSGGVPTPQYQPLGGTDCGVLNLLLCGAGAEGFVGSKAPACGEAAPYAICSGTVLCSGTTESRTQACH